MTKCKIELASIKFDDDTIVEDIDLAAEESIVDGERLTDECSD